MSKIVDVAVPDIGDFKDVPVIELLVKPGDVVSKDDSLIVLESDKATMEIPAPMGGTVRELRLKVGDKVSAGTQILQLAVDGAGRRQRRGRDRLLVVRPLTVREHGQRLCRVAPHDRRVERVGEQRRACALDQLRRRAEVVGVIVGDDDLAQVARLAPERFDRVHYIIRPPGDQASVSTIDTATALVICTWTRSPGLRAAANSRMAGLISTWSVTPSGVLKVTTPVCAS